MRTISIIYLIIFFTACKSSTPVKDASPIQLYPGLFEDVQSAHIFPDSKTFADAIPKQTSSAILADYKKQKSQTSFQLAAFVNDHFTIPAPAAANYITDTAQDVSAHIHSLWKILQRTPDKQETGGSLIALPHPYIVPGGRFREVYYWDSYFTMLGLKEDGDTAQINNIINNFVWLLENHGSIPNGNRSYYLTRSQPPFFSLMLELTNHPVSNYLDALQKEYDFWMHSSQKETDEHVVMMPNGHRMNRYFDKGTWPREEAYTEDVQTAQQAVNSKTKEAIYRELRSGAETGWDFSSRWLEDGQSLKTIHVTDIVPVDLNCLLYHLEKTLAAAYHEKGNNARASEFEQLAKQRAEDIIKYCWDDNKGWFMDFDFKKNTHTNIPSLAGMYPLFFNIAAQVQADTMMKELKTVFLQPGGLVSTPVNTGQQWDAPNGWAPLQWMSIAGLMNYHKDSLAGEIAARWAHLNIKTFSATGKLLEKYNVVDTSLAGGGGEYPNQDGFGWTNGVLLKILHMQERAELKYP
ncbi:alpha,alpha-trehalase TreA [Chitinophaga sancti]|uniref:alpha,alpha-trehalase TreA n=1 Tax=Chitinophaga sancti TaxID=1004 RepID=UPI003F79BE20